MKATLLGLIAVLANSSTAFAHPGHVAATPVGWAHYLTDPYHLFLGLVAAACIGTILRIAVRRLQRPESVKSRS